MVAPAPKSHLNAMLTSRRCKPIERPEELALLHRAQDGDRRAMDRLVEANMKFVAAVARNYQNQGLSVEDLVQEGAVGLQRAIEKFNTASPNRLISYAVWWIRQRMLVALSEQSRSFKLPPRFGDLAMGIERARRRLEQKLNRTPTLDEIANEMEKPLDALGDAIVALTPVDSLDYMITEESALIDVVPGPEDSGEAYELDQQARNLRALLKHLDPVDQEILLRHYGILTGENETLADISERFDISRERVRQRAEKALEKLRPKAKKMNLFTPSSRKATP